MPRYDPNAKAANPPGRLYPTDPGDQKKEEQTMPTTPIEPTTTDTSLTKESTAPVDPVNPTAPVDPAAPAAPAAPEKIDVSDQGSGLSALIIEAQVVDALETVYDPEIPVNIYELGLIYGVDVDPSGYVTITMTLTAPSCPAAQTIPQEIEQKIRAIDGVVDVKIDITFDPPWDMSKMSDAARLQLGFM